MSWLAAGLSSAMMNANVVAAYENRKEQRRVNQAARDYADHAYYRERADALADRQHFEDYNSPAAQVARMKAGGLNPALMYGQGTVGQTEMPGGARATGPSSQPASQIDASGFQKAMEGFMTILYQQQQTDNLRAQAELAQKQALNIESVTDLNRFELWQKRTLSPNVIESSALGLETAKADLALKKQAFSLNLDANERAQLSNSVDVQKTLEEIYTIRQKRLFDLTQQENIDHKAKAEIQKLELEMDQLDQQIDILRVTAAYAEKDAQMKLLLQEFEADIKRGGGGVGGILAKIVSRLSTTLSPNELAKLMERYPLLFERTGVSPSEAAQQRLNKR